MGSWRIVIGYADSSFLVSLYVADANSAAASEAASVARKQFAWTDWHCLEVENALRLRQFRQLGSAAETAEALAAIEDDLEAGILLRVSADLQRSLASARDVSASFAAIVGARSLDIIHVATALDLAASEFFTFDQRQRDLWRMATGRKTLPHSLPPLS